MIRSRVSRFLLFNLIAGVAAGCATVGNRAPSSESSAGWVAESLESGRYDGVLLYSTSKAAAPKALCGSEEYVRSHGCARAPKMTCARIGEYAYLTGSCWSDKITGLLDWRADPLEIDDARLSRTPVNDLAQGIVYRHYRYRENPEITSEAFLNPHHSLYAGIDLQILFPDDVVEKIAENGFLNQHQTHTSRGSLNEKLRWDVEESYLRLKLPRENPRAAELAPKYLLGIPTEAVLGGGLSFDGDNDRYGNVLAVLRGNELKNRTTLTMGDSLVLRQANPPPAARTLKWIQTGAEKINGAYIEAQIWGKLDFSNVDRLLVNCPGFNPLSNRRISEVYLHTHLPIYSCEQVKDEFGAAQMRPVSLIKGDAEDRFQPDAYKRKSWFLFW